MTCPERGGLVDLLYEELEADERAALLLHLEGCAACRERWERVRAVAAAADRWTAPPPPRGVAERALARIASERAREAERRRAGVSLEPILRRVSFGALAAVVSLLLLAGITDRQATPLTLGIVGVIWAGLYAALFLIGGHAGLRPLSRAALAGAGIVLLLAPPLSVPSVVQWCARWVQAAPDSVAFALVVFVAAAGYTAGPLLVGGAVFARPQRSFPASDGARLSLLYAALVAPAVYLECLGLPLAVTAVWMAGAVLGAAAAGPLSLGLAARLRSA